MTSAPRYFLLVMGSSNTTSQKFWTKEEAFSYVSTHWAEASNSEHLIITTDSGSDLYSKDEILSIVRMGKINRIGFPILVLLLFSTLVVPERWVWVSWTSFFVMFLIGLVITTSGVLSGNRAIFRTLFRKK